MPRRRGVDEEIGELADADDRLHLPARVRCVAKQAHADGIVVSRPGDGVAVRRGGRDHAARCDASGAGLVLHDHRHAEALRQLVGENPQRHVGGRAGGERRHDANGLGRIGVGSRRAFAQRWRRERDAREAQRDEHACEARPPRHGIERSPCADHALILFLSAPIVARSLACRGAYDNRRAAEAFCNKNLWRRARFQLAFMVAPWQAAEAASRCTTSARGWRSHDGLHYDLHDDLHGNQKPRRRRFLFVWQ